MPQMKAVIRARAYNTRYYLYNFTVQLVSVFWLAVLWTAIDPKQRRVRLKWRQEHVLWDKQCNRILLSDETRVCRQHMTSFIPQLSIGTLKLTVFPNTLGSLLFHPSNIYGIGKI